MKSHEMWMVCTTFDSRRFHQPVLCKAAAGKAEEEDKA